MSINRYNPLPHFVDDVEMDEADMLPQKIVYFALDADGCLYNPQYFARILYLILHYGVKITSLMATDLSDDDVNTLLNEIIPELEKLADQDYYPLLLAVENKIMPQSKIKNARTAVSSEMYKYISWLDEIDPQIMDKVLELSNKKLLVWMHQFIKLKESSTAYVTNFSSRQDIGLDRTGSEQNGTRLIFEDSSVFHEIAENYMPNFCDIYPDDFCMADIYGDIPMGSSMRKVTECLRNNIPLHEIIMHEHIYDHTKGSLIYAKAHQAALAARSLPHEVEIILVAVDNLPEILFGKYAPAAEEELIGIYPFFSAYPELLPSNVAVTCVHYDGDVRYEDTVQGTGKIDENYPLNIRKMALMCQKIESNTIDLTKDLDVNEFLRQRNIKQFDSPFIAELSMFAKNSNYMFDAGDDKENLPIPRG